VNTVTTLWVTKNETRCSCR